MTDATPEQKADQRADEGMSIPVRVVKNEEPIRVTDRRFWAQDQSAATEAEAAQEIYSFKPAYVEELEKKLADSKRNLDEITASYRDHKAETTAETQRIRERIQNEYNRRFLQARTEVVNRFIDVLENFDRALVAAQSKPAFENLLEGVQLIRNQFLLTLAELGVSELEVQGKQFDPEIAEAVGTVDVSDSEQDQQIIEVVGKGYVLDQALVRPAKVRVGRLAPARTEHSAP